MKHIDYVNNHLLSIYDSEKIMSKKLIFDIETCYTKNEMLDKNYNQKDKRRKTWCFGIGATNTNNVILGRNLDEAMEVFTDIARNIIKEEKPTKAKAKKTQTLKIDIAVHNVAYEISYLQYYLIDNNYEFINGTLDTDDRGIGRVLPITERGTFTISQSDNIYYGMDIILKDEISVNKRGITNNYRVKLSFWDTVKIMPVKLEKAHKFCNNLDEMFYKLNDKFDYDKVRENNHTFTDIEKRYIYNDIRILKDSVNDYYYNGLLKFNFKNREYTVKETKKTASSISFDTALQITFDGKDYKRQFYDKFEIEHRIFNLTDRMKRLETLSYFGGWVLPNGKIINKAIYVNGCSFDINSSYPYQVVNALLPYGMPSQKYGRQKLRKNQVAIYEIGFDYFKPKKKEYELAMIKLGALNYRTTDIAKETKKYLNIDITNGNAYIFTNIVNNKVIELSRNAINNKCSYNMVITSTELEHLEKYYDFGYYERIEVGELTCPIVTENIEFNGVYISDALIYNAERGTFKDFVEHFYNLKSELKERMDNGEEGLDGQYQAVKQILNSFYGKFGTRTERTVDILEQDDNEIFVWDRGGKNKEKERLMKLKNRKRAEEILQSGEYIETYESEPFYKPYASFITAEARIYLQRMIIEAVGVSNFLYSDTDSFYCLGDVKKIEENLTKIGVEVDHINLGAMDNEKQFDVFKTIGAKKYMLRSIKDKDYHKISCKCSGVPEDAQKELCKEGFEEFKLGKEVQGKLAKIKCVGGDDLINVTYVIKDTIIR